MATRYFFVHGANGLLSGLSPIVHALERDGTLLGTIDCDDMGDGSYRRELNDDFLETGIILVFDAGSADAIDRYQVQTFAAESDGLVAALFVKPDGSPLDPSPDVTWAVVKDASGADRTVEAGEWLYIGYGVHVTTVPGDLLSDSSFGIIEEPAASTTPTQAFALTIEGGGGGPSAPPVVAVSPASGTTIGSSAPLEVTITDDDSAIRRTLIVATYATGNAEVVTDGVDFFAPFLSSTSSPTTNGRVYTVRRTGGWRDSPTLRVYAVDTTGSEG